MQLWRGENILSSVEILCLERGVALQLILCAKVCFISVLGLVTTGKREIVDGCWISTHTAIHCTLYCIRQLNSQFLRLMYWKQENGSE